MKKLYWKLTLALLTLFLLFPYASQPLNISVKADETSQSETSESSSSENTEENTSTKAQTTESSDYNSSEPFPSYQNSGTLSDMIGQVFPTAPSVSSAPSTSVIPKKSTTALTADGITINGKFYSNEAFNQLLQKGYLLPNAPIFVVDANGKLDVPLEPRFAMALVPLYFVPGLGQIALAGTAIVLGGVLIYEGTQAYNNVTARLNAAQKAKLNAEKAKAKPKTKEAGKSFNPEKTAKKVLRKGKDRSPENTGYEQEKGEVWSKDRSPNGHGGSRWKRFNNAKDFMNGKRSGTYDSNGNHCENEGRYAK